MSEDCVSIFNLVLDLDSVQSAYSSVREGMNDLYHDMLSGKGLSRILTGV